MELKQILAGACDESISILNEIWNLFEEESVAWYPSAGTDFRDIYELLSNKMLDKKPNIFIHTDYNFDILERSNLFKKFKSKLKKSRTIINEYDNNYNAVISEVHELEITNSSTSYTVKNDFADFPQFSYHEPKVYLLLVSIRDFKDIPVIYFAFENINFLTEILLKNKIQIDFLIKVRDGMAFGGNKFSVANIFAFAVQLGIKYIVADSLVGDAKENVNNRVVEKICKEFSISNKAYRITKIDQIQPDWSTLSVNVYKLINNTQKLDSVTFEHILNTIQKMY